MTIEILYFDGCPNWRLAHERVLEAVAQTQVDAEVGLHLVRDPAEAQAAGMNGSPTILVDGRDPFPRSQQGAWSCRLYRGGPAAEGAPSLADLVAVLR